jgi:hypothetical protein
MAEQLVELHLVLNALNFLQLTFVAAEPASFDVLHPARTFSSGVPLPRTINRGWVHFFCLFSMFPPIALMHPSYKMPSAFHHKSFWAGVNRIV